MSHLKVLPDRRRPLIFAHRGCSSLAPENTMGAFRLARSLKAPGLELDVHLCATGELVVAHDDTFARTAEDGRRIEDLRWDEIRNLDVGAYFGGSQGAERPPLLNEVIEEFLPDLYLDIELKTRRTAQDPLPRAVAAALAAQGKRTAGAVTVSSFNPFALRAFKKAAPSVPTAIIWCADGELPWILRNGEGRWISTCDYLKPIHSKVTPLSMALLGRLGARTMVPWTVDDPNLAKALVARGCGGIITNRPQDMVPYFY